MKKKNGSTNRLGKLVIKSNQDAPSPAQDLSNGRNKRPPPKKINSESLTFVNTLFRPIVFYRLRGGMRTVSSAISSHHLTTLQIILTLLCLFLSVAARWQNGDFFVLLLCRWWVTNVVFISYHNGRRPASAHWEKDDRNNIYLFSLCADLLCVHYRMLRNGKDTRRQVQRRSISDTAASMGPARDK